MVASANSAFSSDADENIESAIEATALENENIDWHKSESELVDECEQTVEPRMHYFEEETVLSCFLESILPLTLAGGGQLTTGLYLDYVRTAKFFTQIPPAYVLVTPLLNLKGNLEMNFASRIATYCHTGEIKTNADLMHLGCINHGLSQSQTISVSSIITIACILINYQMPVNNMIIFLSSVISTASVASFTIETFLMLVIIVARWLGINPDNVGTPIAATVGDISTLFFYASFGYIYIYFCPEGFCFLSLGAVLLSLCLIPFYMRLAASHLSTRRALIAGWVPLFVATIISSGGGFVLSYARENFDAYSLFQPVIVGLVGNMCGIQASRLSSGLHIRHKRGELIFGDYPRGSFLSTLNPITTFFEEGIHSKVALMMICVAIPTQFIFAMILLNISGRQHAIGILFCSSYILCVFILITMFMYFCQVFVHLLWRFHHDPDYGVIPLLTALCDFVGSLLLLVVFIVIKAFTKDDASSELIATKSPIPT